jgi:hypothetical protein
LGGSAHRCFTIRAVSLGRPQIPPLRYPGFLLSLGAFADFMRLSLLKAAHAGVGECSVTGNPGTPWNPRVVKRFAVVWEAGFRKEQKAWLI